MSDLATVHIYLLWFVSRTHHAPTTGRADRSIAFEIRFEHSFAVEPLEATIAAERGADIVRAHDVPENVAAVGPSRPPTATVPDRLDSNVLSIGGRFGDPTTVPTNQRRVRRS